MKRTICLLMVLVMLLGLCACGQKSAEPETTANETAEWSRQGYFTDDSDNMLSVTWMDDVDVPGWYVGVMIGDIMTGCVVPQEGASLHGDLNAWDESAEPLVATVSEEGEDGLLLQFESGETYHFVPMDLPEATIFVTVNVEGRGNIDHSVGETVPEIDTEWPFQSAQINLAEPETYTIVAWPDTGSVFVKWTKNGEDFSTDPQITVLLDESADFVAVFEEDADWQDPVLSVAGEYQSDRAHATVDSFGLGEAWITIEWSGSAWEMSRWLISGFLDEETMTIEYEGSNKSIVVYDENGEINSEEEVYVDGTGTIVFHEDGSFTWHEDQAEDREDMVFERLPQEVSFDMINPWSDITEEEALELCPASFAVPGGAENVQWSALVGEEEYGASGVLVQLMFDLDGYSFTAREQVTEDEGSDLAGMYYDWTTQWEETLKNWADGDITALVYRYAADGECADLCTWYDAAAGVAYSLSVTAEDLDGFDLVAVADMLAR